MKKNEEKCLIKSTVLTGKIDNSSLSKYSLSPSQQIIHTRENYMVTVFSMLDQSHKITVYENLVKLKEIYIRNEFLEDIHNNYGVFIAPDYTLWAFGNMHNSQEFNGFKSIVPINSQSFKTYSLNPNNTETDGILQKVAPETVHGAGFSYVSMHEYKGEVFMQCRKHLRPGMSWTNDKNLMSYAVLRKTENDEFYEIKPDGVNPFFNYRTGVNDSPYQRFADHLHVENGKYAAASCSFDPDSPYVSASRPNVLDIGISDGILFNKSRVELPEDNMGLDFNVSLAMNSKHDYLVAFTYFDSQGVETPSIVYNGEFIHTDYHNVAYNHKLTFLNDRWCLVTCPGRFSNTMLLDTETLELHNYQFNLPLGELAPTLDGGITYVHKSAENEVYALSVGNGTHHIVKLNFYFS